GDTAPEGVRVEQTDQEEVATPQLGQLADPAEQVGLARAFLSPDHDADRTDVRAAFSHLDTIQDGVEQRRMQPVDVSSRRAPDVSAGRRVVELEVRERLQSLGHDAPVAIACLGWLPSTRAAARVRASSIF